MRPLLTLLAVLSLVVRWADAPCGCAVHNGWAAVAGGHEEHGHGHGDGETAAFGHDCGGTGLPVFAGTVPPPQAAAPASVSLVAVEPPAAPSVDPSDVSVLGAPPLRAALNVYRV